MQKSLSDQLRSSTDVTLLAVALDQQSAAAVREAAIDPPKMLSIRFSEISDFGSVNRNARTIQQALESEHSVALLDFDIDPMGAIGAAEKLSAVFGKRACIIGLGSSLSPNLIIEAMRAGCSDFLTKPLTLKDVSASLGRTVKRQETQEHYQMSGGQVIAFIGTKGGSGTTTLAVHLASYLVRSHNKRVLLIDHHHQLGHVCLYLGMDANYYSFQELVRNVDRLDEGLLNCYVARHASGLDVLASPDTFDLNSESAAEDEVKTIEFLRSQYDYVLLDCEPGLTPTNLAIMEQTDSFYLVSTPDVAALRDLTRYVDRLLQANLLDGKMQIAVNRYSSKSAVSIEQIQAAIRMSVSIAIPNEYFELVKAINEGKPIPPQWKSEFSRQFGKWAERLVSTLSIEAHPPTSKGRLAFWK